MMSSSWQKCKFHEIVENFQRPLAKLTSCDCVTNLHPILTDLTYKILNLTGAYFNWLHHIPRWSKGRPTRMRLDDESNGKV